MSDNTDIDPLVSAPSAPECRGISGWLILIALNVLGAPIFYSVQIFNLIQERQTDLATDVASTVMYAVAFTLVGLMLAGWVTAAVLMFTHKRAFVKLWFVLTIPWIAYLFVKAYVFHGTRMQDDLAAPQALAILLIWVPYMLMSERVKNTFVH
jgi:hypothetical protein